MSDTPTQVEGGWDDRWDDDPDAEHDFSDAPTRENTSTTATQVQHEDIRTLRERAKAFDEARAAMPALQRENALLRSGIDLESPLGKFFVESYGGDLTDVEGLRAKAAELGVPFKGQTPP